MSIRDFIALHSTPPSPMPIAAVLEIPKPIVLEPSNLDLETTTASSASCENVLENGTPFHWDVESRSAAKLGKGKEERWRPCLRRAPLNRGAVRQFYPW